MKEETQMLHGKGRFSTKGLIEIFRHGQPLGVRMTYSGASKNIHYSLRRKNNNLYSLMSQIILTLITSIKEVLTFFISNKYS